MMTPRATYRLQFNENFTLDDAAAILPYLSQLGITHIYASPIFTARSHSLHFYDVTDPTAISPALGGRPAFDRLTAALKAQGMGLIIDIVPNHMAASAENPWWLDVLQEGVKSRFARFFDINWRPADPQLQNKILLPILGEPLAESLNRGLIRLDYDPDRSRLVLRYFDHLLPVAAKSYTSLLEALGGPFRDIAPEMAVRLSGKSDEAGSTPTTLHRLYTQQKNAMDAGLGRFNLPGSTMLVHLLGQQHYLLAPWQDAASRINWRRFFDITDLIALRMDRAEVFTATHALVIELMQQGQIDGVRLDHVDGLTDPKGYCRRLRRDLKRAATKGGRAEDPYIVVEKILDTDETVPAAWSVNGSTGYDFMTQVAGVLHDPAGETPLTALWINATSDDRDFAAIAIAARHETLHALFRRQFDDLVDLLQAAARNGRSLLGRDRIHRGLKILLSYFRRYRLYGDADGLSAEDERELDICRRRAALDVSEAEQQDLAAVCAALREAREDNRRALTALLRFQQLSATLAAKAVEDTAFYRYGRLLSRNDVGSDPASFALSAEQFHAANQRRQRLSPATLLTTATHDHKRGEDVRCRLAVISTDAEHWGALVAQWLERHQEAAPLVPGGDKLMIYQMVVGAWPLDLAPADATGIGHFRDRLSGWLTKALREAKVKTSWLRPDDAYEAACQNFLARLLDAGRPDDFIDTAAAYVERIAAPAALNGLSQVLLRITTPGIPDLYQGCDLWDFSLVDPDNRRPVDYRSRTESLQQTASLPALLAEWRGGRIKQRLIQKLLQLRREQDDLFRHGRYLPLALSGPHANHLIAFARQHRDRSIITVAPRLLSPAWFEDRELTPRRNIWRDTYLHLPQQFDGVPLQHALTPGEAFSSKAILAASELLEPFPLCLLVQAETAVNATAEA